MRFTALFVVYACLLNAPSSDAFVNPHKKQYAHVNDARSPKVNYGISNNNARRLQAFPADVDGAVQLASAASQSITSSSLFEYFLQTVISYAVPSFFTIAVIGFAAKAFKKQPSDDRLMDDDSVIAELYSDLYGDGTKGQKPVPPFPPLGKPKKPPMKNLGIPSQEYIKITSLNEKFDSYDFSISAATKSKAAAAAHYRSKSFDRALKLSLAGGNELPSYAKTQMLEAEKEFLKKGKPLVERLQYLEKLLTREAIDKELKSLGVEHFEMDPEPLETTEDSDGTAANVTSAVVKSQTTELPKSSLLQEISKLQREIKQAELEFIQELVSAVGPDRAYALRSAILGDIAGRGAGGLLLQIEDRPLSSMLGGMSSEQKSLFVMRFPGDVTASQLDGLREEVTAVIRNAKPGDEVLVVLQSGGGTVTGYGLAAGQLVRMKEKGLFLTIAVEQVAASGGYMMTCVADKIVASPFAVLGSIGVISEIPNVYERLKEEGIEFQTVTAGKFKRTITPTKKVTPEDFAKAKEDVEMILQQFSGFVKKNRPSLDIESVATGETWFGTAALEKGLCDEIGTVDDVLLKYVDDNYKVYEVKYSPPLEVPSGLAGLFAGSPSGIEDSSIARNLIHWLVKSVSEEILSLDQSTDSTKKYMAKDNTADRTRL